MKGKNVFFALGLVLTMGLGVAASMAGAKEVMKAEAAETTIYLKPGVWDTGGAKYAAYVWNGGGNHWFGMQTYTTNPDYQYVTIDTATYADVIFVRLRPSSAEGYDSNNSGLNWNNKWNQTGNLTFDGNCYSISDWGSPEASPGAWSNYDGSAAAHDYTLVGTFQTTPWSPADTTYDMAQSAGVASYSGLHLSAGDKVKIVRDHAWAVSYGYDQLDSDSDDYFNKDDSNMEAKADGTYSFDFTISSSSIAVTFVPDSVDYYVKVAGGSYTKMNPAGSSTYDVDKTRYHYTLDITASEGQKLFFKKNNSTDIYPGASDPELTNNLFYNEDNKEITVLQAVSGEELRLDVYEDGGYDSHLDGYVAAPKTFYFTNNNDDWAGTPNIYLIDGNDHEKEAWPGVPMTFVDIDPNNDLRYSASVDFQKWPTMIISDEDGSEQTVNLDLASYSTSNGFYLTTHPADTWNVGTYTYEPVVNRRINVGGIYYSIVESASQPGGDCLVQYETAENVPMQAGDNVRYVIGTDVQTSILEPYGKNNGYDEAGEHKVLAQHTGKVYLKLMKNGSSVLFVSGLENLEADYHIFMNNEQVFELVDSGEVPTGYDAQTYCEDVTFHPGDKFKLIDVSQSSALPTVFYPKGGLDEYTVPGFTMDESHYVVYSGSKNYEGTIYLKIKFDADMIYIGDAPEHISMAKKFAEDFNEAISAVCDDSGVTTVRSALEAAWATQASAYSALSATAYGQKAQLELKNESSSVPEILAFQEKYKRVYNLRAVKSGWTLSDFAGLCPSSNNIMNRTNTNNVVLIVTLVSVTVVIASAGVALYLLKKKKHN